MTQSMRRDALLRTGSGDGPLESVLNGGPTHGFGRHMHGLLTHAFLRESIAALRLPPATTDSREKEPGMLVPFPPKPELMDHLLRNGDVTRFATFALKHRQATAFGINVRNLNMNALGKTQTTRVEKSKASLEAGFRDVRENGADFAFGEDHG